MANATLDLSDPQQARIAARLEEEEYAYLTTVRPDGSPHTVPICFVWDGSVIYIFAQPESVKCRHLRQNPHVSLAIFFRGVMGPENMTIVVEGEGEGELRDEPGVNFLMPGNVAKYTPLAERLGASLKRLAQYYSHTIRVTPTRFRQDE
jgi:PPOX class probable F420-dependent enzyme